ncbi:MAG: phosphotransferase family protein [Pseudomonadales bacterium]|nr:phosphotransferase family protein [Pseudomonadales bacterium]
MSNQDPALAGRLERALVRHLSGRLGDAPQVERLRRLTAGAANETWRFDAVGAEARLDCVLRRAPYVVEDTDASDEAAGLDKAGEARVQEAARRAGVEAAQVLFVLEPEDDLGAGYLMLALEGETLARRILRDDAYAQARARLAFQCGTTLARLHAVDIATLPTLTTSTAVTQIERYGALYRACEQPVPVFDLALRWLAERCPDPERVTLVHGDFRNGNLMIGPEGIRAVLDWELAHLGDPMEDLGWLCVTSWRFGEIDHPVGGFGSREDLAAGYAAAGGGAVDLEAVRYWEVLGTLKWGIMCMTMTRAHLTGAARSVERAAIGRRVSETELDLLGLLASDAGLRPSAARVARGPDEQGGAPADGLALQRPTAVELVTAVREFVEGEVQGALTGSTAFHARVAVNVLKIVERELETGAALAEDDAARLAALLGHPGRPAALSAELAEAIRAGRIGLQTPGLVAHLRDSILGRLSIDNPRYVSYQRARAADGGASH